MFTISDLSLHFPQIARTLLNDCQYLFGLSESVCTMGAQDAHTGAQKTVCCMCFDISDALPQGDGMLSHIVTGDETWLSHITPESKQKSLHWKHTNSPESKKFKQTF